MATWTILQFAVVAALLTAAKAMDVNADVQFKNYKTVKGHILDFGVSQGVGPVAIGADVSTDDDFATYDVGVSARMPKLGLQMDYSSQKKAVTTVRVSEQLTAPLLGLTADGTYNLQDSSANVRATIRPPGFSASVDYHSVKGLGDLSVATKVPLGVATVAVNPVYHFRSRVLQLRANTRLAGTGTIITANVAKLAEGELLDTKGGLWLDMAKQVPRMLLPQTLFKKTRFGLRQGNLPGSGELLADWVPFKSLDVEYRQPITKTPLLVRLKASVPTSLPKPTTKPFDVKEAKTSVKVAASVGYHF